VKPRTSSRVALGLWVWALLLLAGGLTLFAFGGRGRFAGPGGSGRLLEFTGIVVGVVVLSSLGAFVSARRPTNPVGWAFLGAGLAFAYAVIAPQYIRWAVVDHPGSLPFATWAAWTLDVTGGASIWIPVFILLFLFPTGRQLSWRWASVFWLGVATQVELVLGAATAPRLAVDVAEGIENPLHLPAVRPTLDALGSVAWLVVIPVWVVGAACLVVRYRRSVGIERQQLKWIAGSALPVFFGAAAILVNVVARVPLLEETVLAPALVGVGLASMPVTASIAILRYRLFDIDRILSRTVAYAVITGLLGAAYAGLVFVLGTTLRPISRGNDLAIASSILIVAALFRPVRRRVQSAIDRRFDRARYDASRTIEAFGARLRNEIDIDALGVELGAVVDRAMHPAHVSLWVRGEAHEPAP
jgi:hypothetical protein